MHVHTHDHDDHEHGHHHHPVPTNFNRAFLIGIILNIAFVIAESIAGVISHSVALLADAGHNLSDVLGLALAWFAFYLSKKPASSRFTFGLRSSTILAALANATFLFITIGALSWEAIGRFSHPNEVTGSLVSWVAGIGILINGGTALLFYADRKNDLNIAGAYTHMMADAVVSFAVLLSGLAIQFTGLFWIDPAMSLIVNTVIAWGTFRLLKDSAYLALQSVPKSIDLGSVESFLSSYPGVIHLHDLHVWALSTTENALSAHIVFENGHPGDDTLEKLRQEIDHTFQIHHTTLQIELGIVDHSCGLE